MRAREYLLIKKPCKGKHVHFRLRQEDKRNTLPYTDFAVSHSWNSDMLKIGFIMSKIRNFFTKNFILSQENDINLQGCLFKVLE